MDPYRIPAEQFIPDSLDFAYAVFSTDLRIQEFARLKFEVPKDDDDPEKTALKQAVLRLWHMAKDYKSDPTGKAHRPSSVVRICYDEAVTLSERVGRRWDSTPIPTLVEALSDKERLYGLGFPTIHMEPGAMVTVSTQPYLVFRACRLVLGPEEVARHILVHDIRVGKNSMSCNSCGLNGSCFSSTAFPFKLQMDTAQVGQTISLYLKNTSDDERVMVTPTMFGNALEMKDWGQR